jgi:hypothetical protein
MTANRSSRCLPSLLHELSKQPAETERLEALTM